MEGVIWFILAAILTFIIFAFICKNTRIVSFDGVGGFLNGYLSNFIWSAIFGAGISAFIIYAFESILTSKIFWGIVIAICILGYLLSGDSKKQRYEEFSKSNLQRIGIRLRDKNKDGKRELYELFIIPGSVYHSMDKTGEGSFEAVGFLTTENDNGSVDKVEDMFYRTIKFEIMDDGSIEYYFVVAYDESKFPIQNHRLKDYTRFLDNLNNWYTGPNNPKLEGDKKFRIAFANNDCKIDLQGSKVFDIVYREFLKLPQDEK